MNEFEWIEDISAGVHKVIIEFPKDKYGWDDVDDFVLYMGENYPEVDCMSPLNPNEHDGGVKFFIEPMRLEWMTDEHVYDMSWSDYEWKGDDITKIEEYIVMEWDEFRKSKIQIG